MTTRRFVPRKREMKHRFFWLGLRFCFPSPRPSPLRNWPCATSLAAGHRRSFGLCRKWPETRNFLSGPLRSGRSKRSFRQACFPERPRLGLVFAGVSTTDGIQRADLWAKTSPLEERARGEEVVTPGSRSCTRPELCLCPSPQPSPRAPLAGRGSSPRWQCQDAPF